MIYFDRVPYNDIIDNVGLYNRALTEQEINAIIQKPCFVFSFLLPFRLVWVGF
ncbi:MAG: hypothetical protein HW390_2755 [Candidatus Brocadiaceae bacterium]|nr:hypothetical protein [Candidatus Brocadiaceae bacterium]